MQIRLSVADGDEAQALYQWLAAETAIRTHGRLAAETGAPGEGDMTGGVLEAILLVVGSGVSLAQLFVAIASWRATRPRPYRVSVELPDRTITIETADPDEALEIARRLESD